MKLLTFLWTALLCLASCTISGPGTLSSIPLSPKEDKSYIEVFNKWHKEINIFSEFQNRIEAHALFLSDDFRKAYHKRFESIRGETIDPFNQETGADFGILISVTTPDHYFEEVDSRNIWTLKLAYGSLDLANPDIRSLKEKEILEPFFPFVSKWSKEFLVVFNLKKEEGKAELPQKVKLSMRSSLATIEMEWYN